MQIIKEKLEIEDSLEKKINNILKFLNITSNLKNGNIINIKNTNSNYIKLHKIVINNTIFLAFNYSTDISISNLNRKIKLVELENYIMNTV